MCYNCGCGNPGDDMGNEDNITTKTFEDASRASSQDVMTAKLETLKLLKQELTDEAK